MVNVMHKIVELIILGVGILVYYTGFNAAVIAALPNTTALDIAMGSVISIVPALVVIFLGIEIAFPGAISSRIK